MKERERRHLSFKDAEIRLIKKEGEPTIITGYFAKFNSLSENLGGFREIIEPGFFREALKNSDVVDLFNHDANYVLGRESAETLEIKEDNIGLAYRCIAPDTQLIKDMVLSPIARGDIKGNSFGFRITGDGDSWDEDEEGRIVRTLKADGCRDLLDGSQVTFPAYPDTEVSLRCKDKITEIEKRAAETSGKNRSVTALRQEDGKKERYLKAKGYLQNA